MKQLANSFLNYNKDAPDSNTSSNSKSMTDILYNLQNGNYRSGSDINLSTDLITGNNLPETILISFAKAHITNLMTLLQQFPTNTVSTFRILLLIPTGICQLQKICQGFQKYEVKKKKQVSLISWF